MSPHYAPEERHKAVGEPFDGIQRIEIEILQTYPDAELHPWFTCFWRNPS